jgi:hypothetical protein
MTEQDIDAAVSQMEQEAELFQAQKPAQGDSERTHVQQEERPRITGSYIGKIRN